MPEKKILVVEDESIIAEDIRMNLEDLGYTVPAVVSSGEAAILKVKETGPDLVLMDIMLKGEMDGIDTAEKIHSNFNIPVVFLTAYGDEKTLERAKVTEPFGYIIKPFKQRELNINIEIALHKNEMDKKLKRSKEWLSTTLKSIGDAVIATDMKDTIIFMNPVAQNMTGWKLGEAKGKDLNEVYNITFEESEELTEGPVTKVIGEGVVVGQVNQTILIGKDGRKIPIEDTSDPIKDSEGNIIGSVLVFRDVGERREAEEDLMNLKEFFEDVMDSLIYGIFVTNKDDKICFSNKSMKEVREMSGDQFLKDLPEQTLEVLNPYYLKVKETLKPLNYTDLPFFTREGYKSMKSGWLIPRIKKGKFNGMICTVEEIQ